MQFQPTFHHYVELNDDIFAEKIEVEGVIIVLVIGIMLTELLRCKCCRWLL